MPYVKYDTKTLRCTVNPLIGREQETMVEQPAPERKKKVLVVGGGPAGMQAAITAADRGHEVILCEKEHRLGGVINFAEHVPFKADLKKFRAFLTQRVNDRAIRVMLNTEVTPELAEEISPDVIIAAMGAEPLVPRIPGVDGENVVKAIDIYNEDVTIGDKVVIIGGGLVGCEEALHLAQLGKKVTVLEMRPEVVMDDAYLHRLALLLEIEKWPVELLTNTMCKSITEEGVVAVDKDGNEKLYKADTVVLAVGMKAKSEEVDSLRGYATEFYTIGDCLRSKTVLEAVRGGYDAGMTI